MESLTEVPRETPTEVGTCSKCSEPLDIMPEPGTARWCKSCRKKYQSEYQADYRARKEAQAKGQGFAEGASAAKDLLAREFETAIRGAQISGYEAARLVRACRGPVLPS